MKRAAALLLVALIAFTGVVSHALIASSYFEAMLIDRGKAVGVDWSGQADIPQLVVPVILMDSELIHTAGNGAYVFKTVMLDEHGEEIGRVSPIGSAIVFALMADDAQWGIFVPLPFLIPFVLHLFLAWLVPSVIRLSMARVRGYTVSQSNYGVLISAVYAYFIMIVFQSARMVWGSQMWEPGSYLNSYRSGWVSLYLLLGLSIAIYLYCVIGTAGLQVCRKPTAKKQTCIRCGYPTDGLERCPECDLEVGAFIPSKLRINHWYLAGMFVVTFFSPVLVESVYSVFG